MKNENIKKVTNQAIEQLLTALDRGQSEVLTKYLAAIARFRAYSLLNVLLILKAFPHATRVAGYKTWQSFGRHVKQGEKGMMILAPVFRKKDDNRTQSQTAEKENTVAGFRAVYVWDESQTAGRAMPEIATVTGDPSVHLTRLKEFAKKRGVTLTYSDSIAPARGMAQNGKITLLRDMSDAETFATLVHEFAHSELHFGEGCGATDKRLRETEAEAVSFVVSAAIGLETGTACSDYIGLYGGDSKLLLESLERVQVTASRILEGIEIAPLRQAA